MKNYLFTVVAVFVLLSAPSGSAQASLLTYSQSFSQAGFPFLISGPSVSETGTTSASSHSGIVSPDGFTSSATSGFVTASNSGQVHATTNSIAAGGISTSLVQSYVQLHGSLAPSASDRTVSIWLEYDGALQAAADQFSRAQALAQIGLRVNSLYSFQEFFIDTVNVPGPGAKGTSQDIDSGVGCGPATLCASFLVLANTVAVFDIQANTVFGSYAAAAAYCEPHFPGDPECHLHVENAFAQSDFLNTTSLIFGSDSELSFTFDDENFTPTIVKTTDVPEPSTIALIGIAVLSLIGFGAMRRRIGT